MRRVELDGDLRAGRDVAVREIAPGVAVKAGFGAGAEERAGEVGASVKAGKRRPASGGEAGPGAACAAPRRALLAALRGQRARRWLAENRRRRCRCVCVVAALTREATRALLPVLTA